MESARALFGEWWWLVVLVIVTVGLVLIWRELRRIPQRREELKRRMVDCYACGRTISGWEYMKNGGVCDDCKGLKKEEVVGGG